MSFLAAQPDIPSDSQSPMAYDISGPVPVVHGRARIPLRLIESPFNHALFNHGDKRPSGHIYSLALAGCWGPVSRLFDLYVNGKPLGIAGDASGDYMDDERGSWAGPPNNDTHSKVRVYWGTQSQLPDPFLNGSPQHGRLGARNADGSSRVHPAYTGLFYVIFYNLHLDDGGGSIAGTSNIPPIEAEVFVDAGFGHVHHEHGANPIAVGYRWLTDSTWGASLPADLVPLADWQAAAAALDAENSPFVANDSKLLSPVLPETRDLAAALGGLLGHYDGFLQLRGGVIKPDWFRRDPSQWPSATVISRHDLLEDPDIEPGSWEDTVNEVSVDSLNVYERMEEVTVTERNTYVRQVRDTDARETIDGRYIIHPAQQRAYALRELRDRSQPPMKAKLVIPRSKRHGDGSLILPGDLIHLDYEPYSIDLPCRVIEREDRGSSVSLRVERDKGAFPEEYEPPEDDRTLPQIADPETIAHWTLLQLPPEYPDAAILQIAVVATRPHAGISGAQLWVSSTGDFAGEEGPLDNLTAWADRVTIDFATSNEIAFEHLSPLDVVLNRSFGAAEAANGEMLLLINGELISLGVRDGSYGVAPFHKYSCIRGMWGTPSGAVDGLTGFVFPRSVLSQIVRTHELMWPSASGTQTVWVSSRTYTATEVDDATAITSGTLRISLPEITEVTLRRGRLSAVMQHEYGDPVMLLVDPYSSETARRDLIIDRAAGAARMPPVVITPNPASTISLTPRIRLGQRNLDGGNVSFTRGSLRRQSLVVALQAQIPLTPASVNTATDRITMTANEGDPIAFGASTGSDEIPAPLLARTTYYARNPSGGSIQVSESPAGSIINLTSAGVGNFWAHRLLLNYALTPLPQIGAPAHQRSITHYVASVRSDTYPDIEVLTESLSPSFTVLTPDRAFSACTVEIWTEHRATIDGVDFIFGSEGQGQFRHEAV